MMIITINPLELIKLNKKKLANFQEKSEKVLLLKKIQIEKMSEFGSANKIFCSGHFPYFPKEKN